MFIPYMPLSQAAHLLLLLYLVYYLNLNLIYYLGLHFCCFCFMFRPEKEAVDA